MTPDINGIVIIVGNYGSGKSETAVNLAAIGSAQGKRVKITDLDLVNPYFRSREARRPLEKLGVEVVLPPEQYMHADLPILTPAVAGMIKNPGDLTILDAGGDDTGVTVLAALADVLEKPDVQMIQVINPLRPFTQSLEGCLKIKAEIETSAKLPVTGLVSNANLIDETTPEIVYNGYDLVCQMSNATGLKLEFITASSGLMPQLDMDRFDCPVLPIDRRLAPPWKRI
ncbi:MAG: cobalamin biosynthesis protein CbiA [Desulfobacter sp.]|nr:cobalamin biosynthesis protein CbiA [Desulfobacter sp.]WDP87472.1 MAG: cobalamin biosynthesis protein CbiA [Desulfobacter sp.]